jgi:Ca2+-binding EF-hand superfamily protein
MEGADGGGGGVCQVSDAVAQARSAAMSITGELRAIFVENNVDLKTAFRLFDSDKDGIVTAKEFQTGLKRLDMGLTTEQIER